MKMNNIEKVRSVINVNIKGINVSLSFDEAEKLFETLRAKVYECWEWDEKLKLVEERLKNFEESNRQFPDELFLPKNLEK